MADQDRIDSGPLDAVGVVVDTHPLGNAPAQFTKAQNAIADTSGKRGSIRKRAGLKPFTSSAGSGVARGGVGVPAPLGSAGPAWANPFTDLDATIATYTAATVTGTTTPLGATFDDDGFFFNFDWLGDFTEQESQDYLEQAVSKDLYEVRDGDTDGLSTASQPIPITLLGEVTGYWFLALNEAVTQKTNNGTTYSNARTLVFPTGSVRAYNASGAGTGGVSDANYPLVDWFSGASSKEDGYPVCVLNNVLYYAGGYDDYTLGTDAPVLRAYDGYSDRVVLRIPKNIDLSATLQPRAIMSLLAANNRVYIATFDGGTSGAAGGTVVGSVYEYLPLSRGLVKLGATFPTGHQPYSLCWAFGRLWCGTAINQASDATPGRIYWIRPGIDTAWTLDKTFSANEAMVMAMAVFQGKLYAAVDWNSTGAGNSIVYVRSTAGVWSASDTAAIGASTNTDNGYSSLLVFPPENGPVSSPTPALFAVRRRRTGDAGTGALRKFNGTSWSTVHTWDYDTTGASHLDMTYANSTTTIKPVLWITRGYGLMPNSTDGTTWTNRSAQLPGVTSSSEGAAGFAGLILQV